MPQPGDGGVGYSWFAVEVVSVPYIPPPPTRGPTLQPRPHRAADGQGGFFAPIGRRVQFGVPFSGGLVRRIEVRAPVQTTSVRKVTATAPVSIHASKHVQFAVPVTREPAHRYAQALREDDEILMILMSR
jgi:hypothetical protein